MQTADVAWLSLLPAVRAVITSILRKAREGFEPAGNSTAKVRDAFDYAATFPDIIKTADSTDFEQLVLDMNPIFWPNKKPDATAGNEAWRCRSWHFYDVPLNDKKHNAVIWQSNLLKAWARATKDLKSLHNGTYNGPKFSGFNNDDLKFWWLAWLLHMAGDAHQPLHCASNYAPPNDKKGDAGGNRFLLKSGKLHSLWDGMIVKAASEDTFHISTVEDINGSPSVRLGAVSTQWSKDFQPTTADLAQLGINAWVTTGAQAAQDVVYDAIKPGGTPSNDYLKRAKNYARAAAVRGGQRLAMVLNDILS